MFDAFLTGTLIQCLLMVVLALALLQAGFLIYLGRWIKTKVPESRLKPLGFWIPLASVISWIRFAKTLFQNPKIFRGLPIFLVLYIILQGLHWLWILCAWIFFPWSFGYYEGILWFSAGKLLVKVLVFISLISTKVNMNEPRA